jgi:nucleotide-binding universal stress UspA family protein
MAISTKGTAMNLDTIVAATDFSDDAGHAVRRAARLAARHGARLELLHVVDRVGLDAVRAWVREPADLAERLVEDARRLLGRCAAGVGAAASPRVAVGGVLEEILSSCGAAGLLAIGAHGVNPLRDAIVGTSAARLVGRCRTPILVVRQPANDDYRNVLVAVDLQPGSEPVFAAAARLAPDAQPSALHAYEVPFEGMLQRAGVEQAYVDRHREDAFRRAFEDIRRLSAATGGDAERFLPVVARGDAARLTLERAHAIGADLIVMGKRRRSAMEALALGSVTRHVLANAKADVLVLPLAA